MLLVVHGHTGRLESLTSEIMQQRPVHGHTGRLENPNMAKSSRCWVHGHTGRLEKLLLFCSAIS